MKQAAKKAPTERQRFKACFGAIFLDCSDAMVQKCWIRFENMPNPTRTIFLESMINLAIAVIEAREAAKQVPQKAPKP